ncbi:TetR/AcrR family transcriptional regulator [Bifidobacterium vansinderenii]|uniref:TetR family transcriptional regulator n=1 Tax=Bifidobacterium vansinderenii TaxID=1984871 RepID=A0A229VVU7_9BIFI|nr:TetR/AcrR family transcriptional regulator [Bifidobacterium vansinderenii]OXM99736.1 TetR family transcriptional regulator [Bifidobacterium vansinderenii]
MTALQRREQLIAVGRSLFAAKGFEAVSVEEIAATAKVSKPIVYEHFGGKEGLYAVVVDREMQTLTGAMMETLAEPAQGSRQIVENAAMAFLNYIEEHTEGFQVLSRDRPTTDPSGSFNSLLGDVSVRVEDLLVRAFKRHKIPAKGVPYYAQMLVGLMVFTGQYWATHRKMSKEQLAAYIVNLAWNGLSRMEAKPELRYVGGGDHGDHGERPSGGERQDRSHSDTEISPDGNADIAE